MKKFLTWKTSTFALVALLLLLAFGASSCDTSPTSSSNVTSSTSSTSTGVTDQICDHVQYKLACQSVVRRYQYFNDKNKYGYFYGFIQGSDHPVIEYIVQGGVFPADDLISNPNYQEQCNTSGSGACSVVLDKQQPDGTYGTNGNAMFGWRADGAYFEWSGPYAYSETPLHFEGVKQVGCKPGVPGC